MSLTCRSCVQPQMRHLYQLLDDRRIPSDAGYPLLPFIWRYQPSLLHQYRRWSYLIWFPIDQVFHKTHNINIWQFIGKWSSLLFFASFYISLCFSHLKRHHRLTMAAPEIFIILTLCTSIHVKGRGIGTLLGIALVELEIEKQNCSVHLALDLRSGPNQIISLLGFAHLLSSVADELLNTQDNQRCVSRLMLTWHCT